MDSGGVGDDAVHIGNDGAPGPGWHGSSWNRSSQGADVSRTQVMLAADQGELAAVLGGQVPDVAAIGHGNWRRQGAVAVDFQMVVGNGDRQLVTPIAHAELQAGQLVGQGGVEVQDVGAGLDSGESPLYQVDGASHGAQVDPFRRGATLNVADIAVQSLHEKGPGLNSTDAT